ncbi:Sigma-70 region 2 [Ruminococcus flavefaciens]|uniref:Sigma-70 region 2 n=1 Tax=Ruminococcus flavefaciens TaxID=1265 RepID=A0A1H6JDZ9_RUMFL|nr:sigma factor [Ruminococcus flavefaciens]SEH60113.1 Sigma-70 region 2 [Ruminococcus flavefaciens]
MNKEIEDYYEKYGQKVYAYLISITREPDTAQDLTQETFLQAMRSLKTFKNKCSVCT